jgi:uncharacterized repeat protein (TIGR03803 family)
MTGLQRTVALSAAVLFSLVAAGTAAAQTSIIVGTNNNANCAPFSAEYNGEYQQVYTSTAFPGVATITGLKFAFAPDKGSPTVTLTIGLSTTSATVASMSTDYAANKGADFTQVFSGTVTYTDVPYTFDLSFATLPFTYNPTQGNLLLDVVITSITGPTVCFEANQGSVTSRVFNDPATGLPSFTMGYGLVTDFEISGASSPILTTLHAFTGNDSDGANPYAGVIAGPGGVLYGTTLGGGTGGCSDCGTAFSLTPPASPGGVWAESVYGLHYAYRPFAGLTMGPGGALYGTGYHGGSCGSGAVFKLKPPASSGGAWEEESLYAGFCNPDTGAYPKAGLVIGSGGTLYGTSVEGGGTTAFLGAAYALTPPASPGGAWSLADIHPFGLTSGDGSSPTTPVAIGSGGVFYGTLGNGGTAGDGMVYSLTPPASPGVAWTETILYSFDASGGDGTNPQAGVVIGAGGVLYGTTYSGGTGSTCSEGCGTVYSLAPPSSPGGAWTETILHSFAGGVDGANPTAGLAIGSDGALFGTTYSGGSSNEGTLFALSPPGTPGGTWTEDILYNFTGGSDGGNPQGGLVIGAGEVLYGTTYSGGSGLACSGGCGTVFSLAQ